MRKRKRPRSVTVIAWIIIVLHGLALFGLLVVLAMPPATRLQAAVGGEPEAAAYARGLLGGGIGVISGIAMLLGLNWGRLLYLWFVPISLVVTLALSGSKLHSSFPLTVILYIVVLHYLRRADVRAFFQGREEPNASPGEG